MSTKYSCVTCTFAEVPMDEAPCIMCKYCTGDDHSEDNWVSAAIESATTDPVNHPKHYTTHPSGIECIQVTEHMSFNLGNAVKYLWRVDEKGVPIEDLKKAVWYINREIEKRTK